MIRDYVLGFSLVVGMFLLQCGGVWFPIGLLLSVGALKGFWTVMQGLRMEAK
jgi:hypothetical protein